MGIRQVFVAAATIVLLTASASRAEDQNYPTRPIHMIVPFEPGGPNDVLGRIVARKAGEYLHQTIVVENHAGAGGSMGTDMVARATADGYTLLFSGTSSLTINPLLQKAIPYDPIKNFTPLALVGTAPSVLIVPLSLPVKSVPELIALVKQKPGTYNFGSGGIAATPYLAGQLFKTMAGLDIVHIPYKGAAPALVGLLANDVQIYFGGIASIVPLIKSGQVRSLAVTSLKRTPLLPDLPTVAETIPGFEVTNWYGALAPAGTSNEIATRLHDAFTKAAEDLGVRKSLADLGTDPALANPDELRAYMKHELDKWAAVIKAAGIEPE